MCIYIYIYLGVGICFRLLAIAVAAAVGGNITAAAIIKTSVATVTARKLTLTPTEIDFRSPPGPRHLHFGSFSV